ncbi:NADH-ubiquinone oxidoreductase subunit NDUFA12 family protein [Pelagibacteraceae bacterium]|jgi:NADH:ubiquinone oxidoreductase subunit|nr:NADH-ubiquinone oxidoreductase subunit NDUFA12 family protein [Pelagibacteraceae bacterium]|tara:strand:+ start:2112 stop:2471 length:360 start_codon:yes stop_codon:yes gene_type:complete
MINFKQIFTWWHKQSFGTFLRTLFFGKLVGKDESGNKFYKSKKDQRWIIYADNIEASKINSDWYLWMHHTVDDIPQQKNKKKYLWQKDHLENLTGTNKSYSPGKIKKSTENKKYETWKN